MYTLEYILGTVADGQLIGRGFSRRRRVRGFSTDSRSLKKGEAFIALQGENFDGHGFLQDAAGRGASVAIVARERAAGIKQPPPIPLITVPDTLAAYGELATAHRMRFSIPVIAVAGSNGKTSTKELAADILSARYSVLRTEGNLNNLIGVPATMLRMTPDHTAAVIEIGTNMPGEIGRLCGILKPTHGLLTNVGREHLELLGSLDGVALEEGALFQYLAATGGTAFVNLDDRRVARLARPVVRKISYGKSPGADIRGIVGAVDQVGAPSLAIVDNRRKKDAGLRVQLRTPGVHTAGNALAAAAVALELGVPRVSIRRVLESFTPTVYAHGYARLAPCRAAGGAVILNDTYNSNPDSVLVALRTLAAIRPRPGGKRVAVLADMLELGRSSAAEHRKIGEVMAGMRGLSLAVFHGPQMKRAYMAMMAGMSAKTRGVMYFADSGKMCRELSRILGPGDVILVKGSRGMRMERVVTALRETTDNS